MATTHESRLHDDVTQCIGNTPLVKLRRIRPRVAWPRSSAKLESFNPLWSVKDRIAGR